MKNKTYILALLLLPPVLVGSFAVLYKMYNMYNVIHNVLLESKDVQFFKVEELPGARPTKLRISGLAFRSAMSVSKITTKTDGAAIVVLVYLSLAKPATSGSFAYELTVPDTVNEVRFGSSPAPIWTRGETPLHLPH